jgi:hypothetical protein
VQCIHANGTKQPRNRKHRASFQEADEAAIVLRRSRIMIVSPGCALSTATELLELGHEFLLINNPRAPIGCSAVNRRLLVRI